MPLAAINQGLRLGVSLYNGYDPLSSERYWEFARYGDGGGTWLGPYQPQRVSFLQRVAGVTHTLTQDENGSGSKPVTEPGVSVRASAQVGDWTLWEHKYVDDIRPWPNAYVTGDILHIPRETQLPLLAKLARDSLRGAPPAVVDPSGTFYAGRPVGPAPMAPSEILSSPQVRAWRVSASGPAAFVQSEALAPGWKAWVDGKPVAVESANFLFRGVPLEKGAKQVTLVYDSESIRFGWFLSLCGLGALSVCGGLRIGRRGSITAETGRGN